MDTWDRCCLIVWIILVARTIAFRGHWEGYLWTPHLHADTWYRLTPHTGYIPHKHLPAIWGCELLLTCLATLVAIQTTPALVALYARTFLARLWWMLFLELGASWHITCILPLLTIATDITLYIMITQEHTEPLFAVHIPLTTLTAWCLYMNLHAWCVSVKPVTRIQYKARKSRIPTV